MSWGKNVPLFKMRVGAERLYALAYYTLKSKEGTVFQVEAENIVF